MRANGTTSEGGIKTTPNGGGGGCDDEVEDGETHGHHDGEMDKSVAGFI